MRLIDEKGSRVSHLVRTLIAYLVVLAVTNRALAAPFTSLQSGFTQEVFATAPGFMGGVAFAPDGDVYVDFCNGSSGSLRRFDMQATTVVSGTTVHPMVPGSPFSSGAGCGLTNHPNGFLYSNTSSGVTKLDADTGALLATFGPSGNSFGIAVDPQTNHLVYVASGCGASCTLIDIDPVSGTSTNFAVLSLPSGFVDGIYFDATGNFLFLAEYNGHRVTILNRSGALIRHISMASDPDGIAFHSASPKFVVTTNTDGTMTRLDFPSDDFSQVPTVTTFASGGFFGDLAQVGPDGCLYLTQEGTRFDNSTTSTDSSVIRICPGFIIPPGVASPTVTPTQTPTSTPSQSPTVTMNGLAGAVSKSGVSGATPPDGMGTTTINWTINYGLASTLPMSGLTLDDTWSSGQSLVSNSVHTPGERWMSTAPNATSLSFTNALVAPNAKGHTQGFPRPLSGGVLLSGTGDGFNPVVTSNGKVLGVNHHVNPAQIWCYDLNAGAACAGYRKSSGVATGVSPYTVAIGNRLYFNADSEDNQCCGVTGAQAIYCWDTSTDSSCGQSPATGKSSVLAAANGKLFTLNQDGQLSCFDPANNLNNCAGFSTVNLGMPALGGYSSASEDLFTVGSKIYAANWQRKLTCFDVATNTICAGWPSLPTVVNTTASGNARANLFPRLSPGGAVTGICVAGQGTNATCYDLDSGNPTEVALGGVHQMLLGVSSNADTYVGSRVFFANYDTSNKVSCFDWSTQAPCSGSGFTNGFTADASRPYGLTTDGVCVYSYGDGAVLKSWNPITGVTPCNRAATSITVDVDTFYCGANSPVSATWDKVILTDVNLSAGVEFSSLLLTVIDVASGATVFGPTQAIGTSGVFDISSISPALRTLRLTVDEAPINTVAWDDNVPPKATLTFTNSTPVQFCYQTLVTCSGSPQIYSNTIHTSPDSQSATAEVTACAPSPNLSAVKSQPAPSLVPGLTSDYTITVTNNGALAATNARVRDVLPAGLDLIAATGNGWSCSPSTGTSPVGTITCDYSGTIAAMGGSSSVTLSVRPQSGYANATVINYLSVDAAAGTNPPNPLICTALGVPSAGCGAPVASTIGALPPPSATPTITATPTVTPTFAAAVPVVTSPLSPAGAALVLLLAAATTWMLRRSDYTS